MSWYVTIRIGGQATHAQAIEILDQADQIGLLVEQTGERPERIIGGGFVDFETEIPGLVDVDGLIAFYDAEHDSDSFDALEDLLRLRGLPFIRKVDGDDEADGETHWWTPGMDGIGSCRSNHDHEAVLLVKDVKAAVADGTLDDLLAEATIPEIQPFSVKG